LKATIHFLKGSPKPHPVKGPNIFLFESRMINRKRTFGIGPSPDANPLLVCPAATIMPTILVPKALLAQSVR
jgi:hypothetical protein